MNDYYTYQDEREYVREIYWESKGLGRSGATVEPIPEPVMADCPKCNRTGEIRQVARHFLRYCSISQD